MSSLCAVKRGKEQGLRWGCPSELAAVQPEGHQLDRPYAGFVVCMLPSGEMAGMKVLVKLRCSIVWISELQQDVSGDGDHRKATEGPAVPVNTSQQTAGLV